MDIDYISKNTDLLYYIITYTIGMLYCLVYAFSDNCRHLLKQRSFLPVAIVSILLIFLFCVRRLGGDSFLFHYWYINLGVASTKHIASEWIWSGIALFCYSHGISSQTWLGIFAVGYIGCTMWACKKLLREDPLLAMMFFLGAFTFLTYGVNVVRNGFACAVILLAFSFWIENRNKWVFVLLSLFALGCHRTVLLPIVAFLIAQYLFKTPKQVIYLWFLSLIVVLVFGHQVTAVIGSIGFDDRLAGYQNGQIVYANLFRRTGFRWDFALYGFAAVSFYWYVAIYRGIEDKKFNQIASTYTIANAIWLQFTYMGNTDRFAYLSWFMMPMVWAYGCIRVPIWKKQDRVTAGVLFLVLSFSFVMNFIIGNYS